MRFDLRLPIGFLFSIFGAILVVYGFLSPAETYRQSFGINVNLYWGVVLCAFGGVMLAFAIRARGRP
ncbi:MAG: hypothetical protein Q8K82_07305 [Gemmatimonadaceae bacterium]|nr:hypothetical protein [Gemmatimonadaceae bacterium]